MPGKSIYQIHQLLKWFWVNPAGKALVYTAEGPMILKRDLKAEESLKNPSDVKFIGIDESE